MLKDADALAVPQEGFVKIVDRAGVLGEQCLQQGVSSLGGHFFPDQAQTPGDAVNVDIYRQLHLVVIRSAYRERS